MTTGTTSETGHCMKCKTARTMENTETVTMKNGRPAIKGTCADCGTKMFKITKSAQTPAPKVATGTGEHPEGDGAVAEEAEKAPEVTDYLAHANQNGMAIRSKTYRCLVKVASKRHQDINYERVQGDWQEKLTLKPLPAGRLTAKTYTEAWNKSREHRAWEVRHQG